MELLIIHGAIESKKLSDPSLKLQRVTALFVPKNLKISLYQ
jgi:hypothetical protein